MIKKYENEQAVQALDKLIDFLNNNNTRVELVETTPIGKKYIAMHGYYKKEVYVTAGNTVITDFYKNQYVARKVIFHDNNQDLQHKIDTIKHQLEKAGSNKNLRTKILYAFKRFKELQK